MSLHEPLKAGYGYVTPPGGGVPEKGGVLAAVAGCEMTGRMPGTLVRRGHRIYIFTPLAPDDARRDALMSVTEKAVTQAVSLTNPVHVCPQFSILSCIRCFPSVFRTGSNQPYQRYEYSSPACTLSLL